ncbi:imelysin family protein [Marinobacterium sediminicola]|uniref:Iron-regulated protein n=1 Tax=Marinobacterium sediminicola TaxID=518898 RepID=A0ABY1S2V5_9GAMM|nr:imelysin family protein [Marinobacterium sediminicola]ULG69260.1 peptidase [Marinobacterium sediminicola]SMR77609.1 putative iron-regulated protein [Marinobacterium sediminicola]
MTLKRLLLPAVIAAALMSPFTPVAINQASATSAVVDTRASSVNQHYADIAEAVFADSLTAAKQLQAAIDTLLAKPTDANLKAAREAWIAARVPYQQSEVFRFGNAIVDDWEGKVNAWPLDEGLIDYVDDTHYGSESDINAWYSANIIANPRLNIGGKQVNASRIDKALLAETLHEIDGVEANVATGYHAIEFLLWGQDLNGTQPGAGNRPATDFDTENCSNGNCDRRGAYLKAATDLLVDDLTEMANNWKPEGEARKQLAAKGERGALATITTGMGSLSYGELAGERTKLGLMLHDPEEEHDCFSDNTHWSHFYDALGIRNVYLGEYSRMDGSRLSGPSLSSLTQALDPALDEKMRAHLDATQTAAQAMVDAAEQGETFDVLIAAGNTEGNARVQAFVDALTAQTQVLEEVMATLGISDVELEGSDSLDNPSAVLGS